MPARVVLALVLVVSQSTLSPHLFAWSADGHRIIARIATASLSQQAARAVRELLNGQNLVDVASWADEVLAARNRTRRWHSVGIPSAASTYDANRDCGDPRDRDCLVQAVIDQSRILMLRPALVSIPDRAEALKFLVHLIGDLHQPLDCIDNNDNGGRSVRIELSADGRPFLLDLHSVWDSFLVAKRGLTAEQYAALLLEDLKIHPVPEERISIQRWAEESHDVALKVAYTYPGFVVGSPPASIVRIGQTYLDRAQAVVDRQLELAGVRLARMLNALFVTTESRRNQQPGLDHLRKSGPVRQRARRPRSFDGH